MFTCVAICKSRSRSHSTPSIRHSVRPKQFDMGTLAIWFLLRSFWNLYRSIITIIPWMSSKIRFMSELFVFVIYFNVGALAHSFLFWLIWNLYRIFITKISWISSKIRFLSELFLGKKSDFYNYNNKFWEFLMSFSREQLDSYIEFL